MRQTLKLTDSQIELLRCPACKSKLSPREDDEFACTDQICGRVYPVVEGIPILLNEENSVFSISDFTAKRETFFKSRKLDTVRRVAMKFVPSPTKNLSAEPSYSRLAKLLLSQSPHPRVLVIGGSILGRGMEAFASEGAIELIETDVSFGPRAKVICDGHDLPFGAEQFDAVIAQAVLEHVVDPTRCVQEFERVLRPGGFVYAETPFMQQVHAGAPDFTRFSHLGHRRLFRMFDEVDSGVACGPGMALCWSYQYFLMSFARGPIARQAIQVFARFTTAWLKYLDPYLVKHPAAYDAASAVYFLGSKAQSPLSDKDLLKLYRGAL